MVSMSSLVPSEVSLEKRESGMSRETEREKRTREGGLELSHSLALLLDSRELHSISSFA